MTVLSKRQEKAPLTVEVVEDHMGEWRRRRRVEVQQEQAKVADVAEDGQQVLDENELAVDEDGYAERGVGDAVSGRTNNDTQKARGWDDSGDDCAGT